MQLGIRRDRNNIIFFRWMISLRKKQRLLAIARSRM